MLDVGRRCSCVVCEGTSAPRSARDIGVVHCPAVSSPNPPVPSRSLRRPWFALVLGLLVVLGLGVRVVTVVRTQWDAPLTGDSAFYHQSAALIAEGKGYIDPFRYREGYPDRTERMELAHAGEPVLIELPPGLEQPTASHPPIWPYLLAGADRLGLDTPNEQRLLGAFLGALGVLLIGLAGRELFGESVGLLSAGIASVYGFLVLADTALMSECLVAILVSVTTIVAVRWWRSPSWRAALMLGLLSALGALLRSELLAYGPLVMVGALLARRIAWRSWLGQAAVAGAVMMVALAPWAIRNLTVFHRPVLLSPTGTVMAQTNCDATYFGDKIGYWELFCGGVEPATSVDAIPDESDRDLLRREQAQAYMAQHRARLLTVVAPLRVLRMFNIYDPVQTARFDIVVEGRSFRSSIISLVEYWIVAALAVVGVVAAVRRRLPLLVVLLWPALVALVAAAGFGNNRYRTSSEPAFIWLAALAIYSVVGLVLTARRRRHSATTQPTAIITD